MENENIKAECVLCNDDKKEYSGTLRSTSNFRLHVKVNLLFIIYLLLY